jgi:hypothetical protein
VSPRVVQYALIFGVVGVILFAVFYGDEQGWGAGPTLGLSFGAVILAVVVLLMYERVRKRRRRAALPGAAASLGLIPDSAGGAPLPGMPPFHLMSQGMGGTADNVMAGQVRGGPVWLFDYTYFTESTSYNSSTGTTSTSRHDHYFSCALAELGRAVPPMRVAREGFFSSIARGMGFEDVEVGVPEFDRRFKVKATDPQIARQLLDPAVQQWLGSLQERMVFELSDRWMLAYTKQRSIDELAPLLEAATTLRERLPGTAGPLPAG